MEFKSLIEARRRVRKYVASEISAGQRGWRGNRRQKPVGEVVKVS